MNHSFSMQAEVKRIVGDGARSDREWLMWLGERLDSRSTDLGGDTVAMWLSRVLLRVRDRQGLDVALEANRAQQAFERRRGRQNIVVKARQMGISTWVAGRFFLKTITHPGTLTVQVAHNRQAAEQIFTIVHRFYERLPEGLQDGALRTSRVNAGQIVFPEIDSEYRVESAAQANAGRGMTVQNLHCSEVARWGRDAAATLASLRAALAPAGELVLESTPNGANGCFYDEWRRAEASGVVRHFFPWWVEPAYTGQPVDALDWTAEERRLADAHKLTAGQIGFRRQLVADFRSIAAQEYAESAEECFLASGNCVFDLDKVETRAREVDGPLERRRNDQIWIWYPPQRGLEYVVAVDPAGGGTDGDYSAVEVVERRTGLQCAELKGHLDPRSLARIVVELAEEYNGALLVVERNNHGGSVLAYVAGFERYPKIYQQKGLAGWLTSAVSRPEIIERLGILLETAPGIFSSSRLLAECRTFIRHGDGRTSAAAGAHDDCVMAMAIAQAVRTEPPDARRAARG